MTIVPKASSSNPLHVIDVINVQSDAMKVKAPNAPHVFPIQPGVPGLDSLDQEATNRENSKTE